MKNSFILYTENKKQIDLLSLEQKGALLDAIFTYAEGEDPEGLDALTEMAFSFIQARMDRDAEKWEETREKRAEAGRAGGLKSGETRSKTKQNKANEANASRASKNEANEANEAVPVPVPVPVSCSVGVKGTRTKFVPPSVAEVRAYCLERNNGVDPEAFVDFYASKGWKVGNQTMKDWKACIRTWEKRVNNMYAKPKNRFNNFTQRQNLDYAEIERQLIRQARQRRAEGG